MTAVEDHTDPIDDASYAAMLQLMEDGDDVAEDTSSDEDRSSDSDYDDDSVTKSRSKSLPHSKRGTAARSVPKAKSSALRSHDSGKNPATYSLARHLTSIKLWSSLLFVCCLYMTWR
jgi:hypothetical protein